MIRAVVFDMDGVLIDAKEWHYEALNRALATFGYTITRAEHETIYDGLPTRKKLEMLHARSEFPMELASTINVLKQRYTMELAAEKCRPNSQHQRTLTRLKQHGYHLGVASNSIRQTVATMMDLSGLAQYLDVQLSNEDVARPKPDPEIYLRSMHELRVRPDECLIVEDNENGVKAARASGGHVYIVRDVHDVTLENVLEQINRAQPLRRAA